MALAIVDPACGSGHFLLAAARRLAARVARLRAEGTPTPEDYRHALRQVVGRCIYGVDLNPLAVELCKVALWMEAVDPGLPLTFLDSHIRHGNALLGTTRALMSEGIPDEAWVALGRGRGQARHCAQEEEQGRARRPAAPGPRGADWGGRAAGGGRSGRSDAGHRRGLPRPEGGPLGRTARLRTLASREAGPRCLVRGLPLAQGRGRPRHRGGAYDGRLAGPGGRRPPVAGAGGDHRPPRAGLCPVPLGARLPPGLRARRLRRGARQSALGAGEAARTGVLRLAGRRHRRTRSMPPSASGSSMSCRSATPSWRTSGAARAASPRAPPTSSARPGATRCAARAT